MTYSDDTWYRDVSCVACQHPIESRSLRPQFYASLILVKFYVRVQFSDIWWPTYLIAVNITSAENQNAPRKPQALDK